MLVARDEVRLRALAAELPVATEVLAADLADDDQRAPVEARLRSGDEPIDLLVNNAGVGHGGEFVGSDIDEQQRQIDLNVTAVVRLAHAAVAGMVERGRGTILDVSSLAALQPTPGGPLRGERRRS